MNRCPLPGAGRPSAVCQMSSTRLAPTAASCRPSGLNATSRTEPRDCIRRSIAPDDASIRSVAPVPTPAARVWPRTFRVLTAACRSGPNGRTFQVEVSTTQSRPWVASTVVPMKMRLPSALQAQAYTRPPRAPGAETVRSTEWRAVSITATEPPVAIAARPGGPAEACTVEGTPPDSLSLTGRPNRVLRLTGSMNMANGRGSRPSAVGGRKDGSSRGASGPGPVGTGSADATIHGPVADLLGVLPRESTSGARIGSTYRLKLFPPVKSHCTMLPSSAAETTDFPSGAMAMSSMVPRCPLRTCACCHLPPESRWCTTTR